MKSEILKSEFVFLGMVWIRNQNYECMCMLDYLKSELWMCDKFKEFFHGLKSVTNLVSKLKLVFCIKFGGNSRLKLIALHGLKTLLRLLWLKMRIYDSFTTSKIGFCDTWFYKLSRFLMIVGSWKFNFILLDVR